VVGEEEDSLRVVVEELQSHLVGEVVRHTTLEVVAEHLPAEGEELGHIDA
jgi:hypothetical protein